MNKIKNSSMFLLWAGAAISIAEIYTGNLIAPLGIVKGLTAILLGHVIGTALLAFGGYVSFADGKNAMEKVSDSFGLNGGKIVAFLNVLQLIGWSAIMMIQTGRALDGVIPGLHSLGMIITAVVVFLWSWYFNNYSKKINDISVIMLILFCCILFVNFNGGTSIVSKDTISFVTALEISISMPVSWLPLIGDYTKNGESKKGVFISSFAGYFTASSLMYILGMLITIYFGMDVIEFLSANSFKLLGILIILFSTVTTTFLDIYSAVISSKQIFKFENDNLVILIYTVLATILAYIFPIESYQNFLLTIGSVFIPVYTIVFTDYLLKSDKFEGGFNFLGVLLAAAGTALYSWLSGNSFGIPTVIVLFSISLCYLTFKRIFNFRGVVNE